METAFSHYKCMGFFRRSWAANSVVSGPIWPKFEFVRDFMHVLVTCKYKKDRIKRTDKRWRHPIISQWAVSVAMDTRVLIQSASKHYAAFPHPQYCCTYNLIKIGQLASEIFKFESVKFSSFKGKWHQSKWSVPARNQTRPSFFACPSDQQLWWCSIKNERASMETAFSHYKSTGVF